MFLNRINLLKTVGTIINRKNYLRRNFPTTFNSSLLDFNVTSEFHRKSTDSKGQTNKTHKKREAHQGEFQEEKKRSFMYGVIVLSSILALYIYERRNKFLLFDRAKLWSKDDYNGNIIDNNLIGNDNIQDKKKNPPGGGGKYSSMNFFADIVEQASPSVAFIQARGHHPFHPMAVNISSGSGFLVDKQDGIILTNAHVIANCQQVVVQFNDGRTMNGAVEFVDERLDLATVRVPLPKIKDLHPIPLGDSKQTRAGEWVIAVGSPFSLSNTVTVGVISSISRAGRDLGIRDNIEYIQTDASINVGNSGGPLLNLDGQAIGINTLKVGEGISFAIPAFYANEFLKKCKKFRNQNLNSSPWWNHGRNDIDSRFSESAQAPVPNRRVYIGFTIVTLTPHLIESHRQRDPNFPPDVQSGVMIYRIVLGAPAHLSGMESGDIIVAINGKQVHTADEVYRMISTETENGHGQIEFLIKRGQKDLKLKVKPNLAE